MKVFGLTVYVFIHKKEQKAKSAKWKPRKKRKMLVNYDGCIIYRVYLHDKEKIIQIKDLQIFKNAKKKLNTHVVSYDTIATSKSDITSDIFQLLLDSSL